MARHASLPASCPDTGNCVIRAMASNGVRANGAMKGVKKGTVKITVTTAKGEKATVMAKVSWWGGFAA